VPELLRAAIVPIVLVATLLPIIVLVEMIVPKDDYRLKARLPGAIFLILLPGLIIALSWPLQMLWRQVGVEPLVSLRALPEPLRILVALLLIDFLRYWEHRVEHKVWWPVHSVHHSQSELHAANSYSHPLIFVTEFVVIAVPLSFVDFGGSMLVAGVLTAFNDMFIHSPIRPHYGPLRHVFVDNRYHRVHHSIEERHFDKNFGIMFTIWDRLFGTACFPRRDEWPAVGVTSQPPPQSVMDYIFRPLPAWGRKYRRIS
jgi:sterol desaturase/sphingolipid hydroxylase (fatty acid hydroxylase superfamily)